MRIEPFTVRREPPTESHMLLVLVVLVGYGSVIVVGPDERTGCDTGIRRLL
jgi:hypothetical protein